MSASVRQRLLNLARERGEDFNALLAQYAAERLILRVSRSSSAGKFVLKGAMMFRVWTGSMHRPTQDVDFLGYGEAEPDAVAAEFSRLLREVDDPDDGLVFDADAVVAHEIREAQEYPGVRVRIPATLGTARVSVQVDVGFGDAITPDAVETEFPTLLGHEAPRIRAYPQETAVSEKLEAICSIGMANSRMKDYYDLLTLSRRFEFDGQTLTQAIRSTFERRGTPLPSEVPIGLSDEFGTNEDKQKQWRAFLNRTGLADVPAELVRVVEGVRVFLGPALLVAASDETDIQFWTPSERWT